MYPEYTDPGISKQIIGTLPTIRQRLIFLGYVANILQCFEGNTLALVREICLDCQCRPFRSLVTGQAFVLKISIFCIFTSRYELGVGMIRLIKVV